MSLHKQFVKSKNAYKITFSLPKEAAMGAKEVKLLGDFNNWKREKGILMKLKDNQYSASINLNPGEEHQFRYLIDNERWVNDWKADKYKPSPFGVDNSVVIAAN